VAELLADGPTPPALEAMTLKVYEVEPVSHGTEHEVLDAATVQVEPPGLDVTLYPVIVTPVTGTGAVQATTAVLLFVHEETCTEVGAFGVAAAAGSSARNESAMTLTINIAETRRNRACILISPP
jgi:hypothetical protein